MRSQQIATIRLYINSDWKIIICVGVVWGLSYEDIRAAGRGM
jgi:hypothetical protein